MLSNSKHKNDAVKSPVCLVKGPKPLVKHTFYLDIKNPVIESKVQAKIKQFGGKIELFLIRDVTHYVTDKPIPQNQNTDPKTPHASNDSHNSTLDSPFTPTERSTRRKPKSRADAMLERARTSTTPINPLDNAKNWGIPVWSVEKILHWLEKVAASIIKEVKSPYLKFEPISRDARPIFKQYPVWPMINLNVEPGVSPFVITEKSPTPPTTTIVKYQNTDRHKKRKMLRKTRISLRGIKITDHNQITNHQQPQSGYCEICRMDYQDLTKHVRSETHLRFVRDDTNFLSLDSLITAGANVEAFLRLNGSTECFSRRSMRLNASVKNQIEIKINGDDGKKGLLSSPTVKHSLSPSRNTRASSACEKTKDLSPAPISPALSDSGHHLRSRGQIWLPSNLLGTTAEDEGRSVKPRSKPDSLLQIHKEYESDDEIPLIKIKKNRISPKPSPKASPKASPKHLPIKIEDEMKKEVKPKKRATPDDRLLNENRGYYKVEVLSSKLRSSIVPNDTKPVIKEEVDAESLVVKFKRIRKSELSVLSNEAENFMFPRNSSSEHDDLETDDERNTTQEDGPNTDSIPTSPHSSCESETKRRRRTHADIFIQDNEKYYKFETPGSRLRFQGSFLPVIPSKTSEIELPERVSSKLTFTYERIAKKDVKRIQQAQTEQIKRDFDLFCGFYYSKFQPQTLPFERPGNVYAKDPKVCKEEFMKRIEAPSRPPSSDRTNFSEANSLSSDQVSNSSNKLPRKRKVKRYDSTEKSRKSPRQHASTLAILGGLLLQAPRRRKSKLDSETSDPDAHPLTPIHEESLRCPTPQLSLLPDEEEDYVDQDNIDIVNFQDDFNLINILNTYRDSDTLEMGGKEEWNKNMPSSKFTPKEFRRKRKPNRTGWPSVVRRPLTRRLRDELRSDNSEVVDSSGIKSVVRRGRGRRRTKLVDLIDKIEDKENNTAGPSVEERGVEEPITDAVTPSRTLSRNPSSDCLGFTAEECGVDVEKWKVTESLMRKASVEVPNKNRRSSRKDNSEKRIEFQPFVKVQKMDSLKNNRRLRSSSSPSSRTIQPKRIKVASSPKKQETPPPSPRKLRKPRGRWYRDR